MNDALVPAIAPPAAAAETLQVNEARLAPRGEVVARARPHVVVVGAGFAGLHSIRALSGTEVSVTVIDRHNYHLFQPLLYQVATAALEPADISGQLRQVIRGENVEILMCEVEGIDVERNRLELRDRTIDFDYLILATGSSHSYFGHSEWAKRAPGLKTLEDALEIRRRILVAFEEAEREPEPRLRDSWLTFVVIGGGPTGVELAGAIAEISRQNKKHDFRNIDPRRARVILLEGRSRVLMEYPEPLSAAAQRSLERLGVEVRTNAMVTEITDHEVKTATLSIEAQTVLWAAGVASSPVARSLARSPRHAELLDRAGRVRVTPQLSVPGLETIFVVGDLALLEQDGKPLPGLAPVAIAEGKHAAANILRAVRGESQQPFRYDDRGSFAVIGRGAAVGIAWRWRLSGALAWLAWLAIHITFLVGFRNRIAVLFNWAYVYITRRRHAELIIGAVPLPSTTPARDSDGDGRSVRHSDTFERA
ncbi:MAG TPA: NAD(P)/FAD-dependent oxidoreductase [Polyangiaceae bacterium]|nr:NAD(P)/FAD-dependent oxidoreductase [Polyangiaceae bacterium]